MLGTFILLAVFGPLLYSYTPHDFDPMLPEAALYQSPSSEHWLGTDRNGVDVMAQLLWGARKALQLSLIVVAISATIGVTLGTIAGYFRGAVDEVLMRFVDILMAFPGILLNIAIVAVVADPGLPVIIGALVANGWVGYARVARGQALSLRERDYIAAARAIGASNARIVFRHMIPNLLAPVIVQMTFGLGGVILIEASLSFLGLGPQVDYTWGAMMDQGASDGLFREGFWWYTLIPGAAIMWVVLGANLLGDGLRDRLDPRQRGRA
jgi:peptide/nickel transport system permease protein